MDDSDGADKFRHVQRNSGENAGFDFAGYAGLGKNTHSGLDCDGMLDGLDIVELHREIDIHTTLPQGFIDRFADAEATVEGDKCLTLQIAKGHVLSLR